MRTYIFDLRVSFLEAPVDKPRYALGPVELEHFYFGFSVDFSFLEFFLDAFDVTDAYHKLFIKIKIELSFLKCQQKRSFCIYLAHRCYHQRRARKCITMVIKMPLSCTTMF